MPLEEEDIRFFALVLCIRRRPITTPRPHPEPHKLAMPCGAAKTPPDALVVVQLPQSSHEGCPPKMLGLAVTDPTLQQKGRGRTSPQWINWRASFRRLRLPQPCEVSGSQHGVERFQANNSVQSLLPFPSPAPHPRTHTAMVDDQANTGLIYWAKVSARCHWPRVGTPRWLSCCCGVPAPVLFCLLLAVALYDEHAVCQLPAKTVAISTAGVVRLDWSRGWW